MHLQRSIVIILFLTLMVLNGCEKLVEVPPPASELTSDNVYTTDASAASVLTGIYTQIASQNPLSAQSADAISIVAGLSSDELSLYGGTANGNTPFVQYYQNSLSAGLSTATGNTIWS